jgi:predicted DNA-binding protein
MTLSLRLDKKLAKRLAVIAAREGISKSELVRRCLEELVELDRSSGRAWNVGKHLFGRYGSGKGNLARDSERIVREAIDAKHRRP